MIRKYNEKIKKHFQDLLEIKSSPHEIALGFSIGTFFANFPTLGFEFFIIFLILILFKNISKISLILAYAIFNPLITYPMAGLSYVMGDFILKDFPITIFKFAVFHEVIRFTLRFMLGSFILASILAVFGYYIVYYLVNSYKKKEIPILQNPINSF